MRASEREDGARIANRSRRGDRTGWQLDDERGRAGQTVVFPAHGAAWLARQPPQRQADERRESALDRDVTAGLVDDPLMLVEPDRNPRSKAEDQVIGDPALGLEERPRAGVVNAPEAHGKLRLRSTPWAFWRVSAA